MDNTTDNKYDYESFDLIVFILAKLKILLGLTILGAIIAIIVSLVIPDKFKSYVVLFPAPSTSVSKALLTDNVSTKSVVQFGDKEEVEQLLQVLNSDNIRDRIIKDYDLMNHYEIDPESSYPKTKLFKKFKTNIKFHRTEYQAVEIVVLDTDREIAASIANDIANLVDTLMNDMMGQRSRKALQIVEEQYLTLKNQIETLEDSLVLLRSYGVNDYESQAEVFNRAYSEALAAGNMNGAKRIEEKLEILSKYGGAYVAIRDFLEFEKKHLSEVKAKYALAKVDANSDMPHKFVVNKAHPAEKKSYPVRWLIVTISTISTFLLVLLVLIIVDSVTKRL